MRKKQVEMMNTALREGKPEPQNTDWTFKAHLGMSKGKGRSIRMEVRMYNGIELFREIGPGQPIYYVKSDKANYESEEELISAINKPTE